MNQYSFGGGATFGAKQGETRSVRQSIARASVAFNLNDGTQAADLKIENERLLSTIAILNGKLKTQ